MRASSAKAPAAMRHEVHVFADPGCGRRRVTQGTRTVSSHRTQSSAVRAAKRQAKRDRVDLVTHGRNGRIRSKDSYGNEKPVRGSEH